MFKQLLMERLSSKDMMWVFVIIMVLVQVWGSCIEEEKMGLLEFKAFLKLNDENADFLLPSWMNSSTESCCNWERVICSPATGRVEKLLLNDLRKLQHWEEIDWLNYENVKFWSLNVSIFLPFKDLRHLNLSANSFDGFIENHEGFKRLSSLWKLEILDISGNKFVESVIKSLGAITSLKTLVLRSIELNDSFPIQELASLQNLEVLDLSYNDLETFQLMQESASLRNLKALDISYNKFESHQLGKGLSSSKKLEMLDITGNELKKNDIKYLGAITSLKTLVLSGIGVSGSFPLQELANLRNLEVLDLSYNYLESFRLVQDSNNSSIFRRLITLKLDGNIFKNTAIQQLNIFTSLKNLSLQQNNLKGLFPIQEICTLENLTMLDLSWNNLTGMQGFKCLSKLKILEILNLDSNRFSKTIVKQLGGLTSLKSLLIRDNNMEGLFSFQELSILGNLVTLDLSMNRLKGSLSMQGLCQLKGLQELYLSTNSFHGILPPCLNNFTSLRSLDLSFNSLSGNISSQLFHNLNSLEFIYLSYNKFEGSFSFSSLANHSKLQVVILESETNKFEVETEHPVGWVPLFQLKFLILSNCKLIGKVIPGFLRYQFELIGVDLSHNNLTGSFPIWLLENNPRLEFLLLRNNSLTGQLLLPLRPNIPIQLLDVSNNELDGQLQENVGHMFPNTVLLDLSNNNFEGILSSSIAEMSSLKLLDLSSNNFLGEVPKQLLLSAKLLKILKLSNNRFHGEIFSRDFNLSELEYLYLDNNQFMGTLSNAILRSSDLAVLDVSNNYMSGEIPSWIGNMAHLWELLLGSNSFNGRLPPEISQLQELTFLDVSQNALSGSLPSLKGLDRLEHLHLEGNMFTGLIPRDFLSSSSFLLTLDMRDNRLCGSIPNSLISGLSNSDLRILLLRGNLLSGFLPTELCHLTKISLMDLSNNSLSGSIPRCFGHIRFGDEIATEDKVFGQSFHYGYEGTPYNMYELKYLSYTTYEYEENDEVEFVTKNRRDSYGGDILNFMSGLDLSCNNLTGEIPRELGMLSSIRALNLSHNQLNGSVPNSFSNLSQIESLDLSYNELSGEIPPELVRLNFLVVFSVAHNNLSGRVPGLEAQFGTFNESSYEGNPFLCGPLLKRKCSNTSIESASYSPPKSSTESEAKWYDVIDPHVVFFASFAASYIMILLGFATVLYINPYWRRRWFYFIEECLYSCYYFALDTPSQLLSYLYS